MRTNGVMLVGVFTVMFGFYANTSKQADSQLLSLGDGRAAQVQAEMIAESGTKIAAYYMSTPSDWDGWTVNNRAVHSGTMSYTITYDSWSAPNDADVTVIAKYGSVTVTQVSHLRRIVMGGRAGWEQWEVARVYTVPQAPTTSL